MGSLSNTFIPDSSPVVSLYLYLGQGMIWHWFSCWIIIVASAMDNRESTAWVFLDLWKAFDTIDQHSLLNKLDHYNIRGHSFNWVSSYLTHRKQLVQFTSACCQPEPTVCGTVNSLLTDTSIRRTPPWNRHLELVPAFLYFLYLTLYKTDISLRWTLTAGPKGVRLRGSWLYSPRTNCRTSFVYYLY